MVALLLASYFFVFAKASAKKKDLLADIQSKQTELSNLRQATVGIDDLGRKIDELQKAIAFFESKLPQEKEVDKSKFIGDLQAIEAGRTLFANGCAAWSRLPTKASAR